MPTTKPPKVINPVSQSAQRAKRALLIALSTGILAIIAIALATTAWLKLTKINKAVSITNQELRSNLAKANTQLKASLQVLRGQLKDQHETLSAIQFHLARIIQTTGQAKKKVLLSDIAFLIHSAHLRLTIEHNVSAATLLLSMAKSSIQPIDDPVLFTLKKAINHDLAELSLVPTIDRTTLISHLDTIIEKVNQLPILPNQMNTAKTPATTDATTANKKWYQQLWHNLADLKGLIIIRHIRKPIMPLLTPQQETFLKQNITTKLLQAQWALLQENNALYQHSLNIAMQWIGTYFHNAEKTQHIIAELTRLKAINISPKLPTLTQTLTALSAVLSSQIEPPSQKQPPIKTPTDKAVKKSPPQSKTHNSNPGVEI